MYIAGIAQASLRASKQGQVRIPAPTSIERSGPFHGFGRESEASQIATVYACLLAQVAGH
jgi:hypothetical protein